MSDLKKDLVALNTELKALSKKTEALIKALGKPQKKVPAPAKAAKKAPAPKKAATITDAEKVFRIVKRSQKGVAVVNLRKKTGFDAKKISNIVHRALKQGKLKRIGKGVYGLA